ncbi:uncharacterized protein LOC128958185 [Oppia nitens]|uniref:uncharacterized protein LOC128958185 n=1 Tax=Oppia nitens TaxID=1686743 RepID=UPI0023DC0083|nr:uncharacterized protein LOC128958185 [Oppia nitens]
MSGSGRFNVTRVSNQSSQTTGRFNVTRSSTGPTPTTDQSTQSREQASGSEPPISEIYPNLNDLLDKWQQWSDVGDQYKVLIPKDLPLLVDEVRIAEENGINFIEMIGSGGFASIWKVKCSRLLSNRQGMSNYTDKEIACKIISLQRYARNRTPYEAVNEMLREYTIHKHLVHPNIVRSEEVFNIIDKRTEFPFVRHLHFMELCTGSLQQLMNGGTLSETDARVWFKQVCQGLRYLHSKGVAHLDIKIENILYIDSNGERTYKLCDYGLSRIAQQVFGFTGTIRYMAPESRTLVSQTPIQTFPIDIWCLGLAVCESLGGNRKHNEIRDIINSITDQTVVNHMVEEGRLRLTTYEFCQLIQCMVVINPIYRPTIHQIIAHRWLQLN